MTIKVVVESSTSPVVVELALAAPLPVGLFPSYYIFDSIEFDQNPAVAMAPGRMRWNAEEGTNEVGQGYGGAVMQVGRETYILASNTDVSALPDGSAVQFTGAGLGSNPGISLAKADGTVNPYRTLGLLTQQIDPASNGLVTTFGKVHGLDTTGASVGEVWVAGDTLFCHPTQPGKLTKVRPPVPNMTIAIGAVVAVHATDGVVFVSPRILGRMVFVGAHSSVQQNLGAGNAAQAVALATVNSSMGITATANSFTPDTAGFYQVDFTLSVRKTGGSQRKLWVWARRAGVDVPSTAMTVSISGATTELSVSGSVSLSLEIGQSFQLMFAADSTEVYLDAEAATAFAPASPSARMTLRQINP